MFSFEWSELRDSLEQLAASPAQEERARSLVGGIAKHASGLGHAKTLELILVAAHYVQHEDPSQLIEDHPSLSLLH